MSMEEVNERFPLSKYKTWRSTREAEGLPTAGGVTAPPSRAASMKDEAIGDDNGSSTDTTRPATALSLAQQDHANATSTVRPGSPDATEGAANQEQTAEKPQGERRPSESTPSAADVNRNASVVTIDDEDEDDPIRTAAPPEMLAVPGDTCAICLDTLEDDDDVRGLTCGHAFHAACVDPWLTSRRACCPLCKADYYIPKPRTEGTEDATQPTGRRSATRGIAQPPPVWIGGRAGMAFGRPRLIFAGPRFFLTDDGRNTYSATPSRQERRRREQDVFYQDPTAQRQQQETVSANGGSGGGGDGWRSRLPAMPNVRLPRFGRSGGSQQAASGEVGTVDAVGTTTPAELEEGNNRTGTGHTTYRMNLHGG